MTVRRNRRLEKEVVAERESERQLVMIRARVDAERKRGLAVDRPPGPGLGDIAEQQIVRRVFLVDEHHVLDL